jgi:Flp pilus assembly protein TadG
VTGEDGHAAVELSLAVAVLLLPVAIAVLGFGPWSERRVFARAAAAEAARAAVIDLDVESGNRVISEMASDQGLSNEMVRVTWCGGEPTELGTDSGTCVFARGGVITVGVEVFVPVVATPWGAIGGVWAAAAHGEPVDLYRSLS